MIDRYTDSSTIHVLFSQGWGLMETQVFVQNFWGFYRNHKLSFPIPQNMFYSKNLTQFYT